MQRLFLVLFLISTQVHGISCFKQLAIACVEFVCGPRRYEKIKPLGEGGFAVLSLNKRLSDGVLVAHKSAKTSLLSPWNNDLTQGSIEDEAEIYRILNPKNDSPFLPKSYGMITDNYGKKVLELEFLEGLDLEKYTEQQKTKVRDSFYDSLTELLKITDSLTARLRFIHSKGVLHSDIKADNIMRLENGSLYIIDFGIPMIRNDETKTYSHPKGGSDDYRAPEVNRKLKNPDKNDLTPIGPPSDYYSLGVLLKEIHEEWFSPENFKPEFSTNVVERNSQIIEFEKRKRLAKKFEDELIYPLLRNLPHERISPDEIMFRVQQLQKELEE